MSEWDKVDSVKDLSITVDGGKESSSIFGNGRNSAVVTIRFTGLDNLGQDIDLRKENIQRYIYLIDFETGKELPWKRAPKNETGLYYSDRNGLFCNRQESASSIKEEQAYVTFFVYGKCTVEMRKSVAIKFILPGEKVKYTSRKYGDPHKVEIKISEPVKYVSSNLEKLHWVVVSDKPDIYRQEVAFIKLRSEFKYSWARSSIGGLSTTGEDLVFVSSNHYTQAMEYGRSKKDKLYNYYLCQLGKESIYKQRLRYPIAGLHEMDLVCNQEPGSLCIVRTFFYPPKVEDYANYNKFYWINDIEPRSIRLYDNCGNLGTFQMKFEPDPNFPTIDDV